MSQNGVRPAKVPHLGFNWDAPPSKRSAHENFIHSTDWSATALGPPSKWPAQLREAVDFALADPTPAAVMWGEDLTVSRNLSNDHNHLSLIYLICLSGRFDSELQGRVHKI
jgi:hypothetical protein